MTKNIREELQSKAYWHVDVSPMSSSIDIQAPASAGQLLDQSAIASKVEKARSLVRGQDFPLPANSHEGAKWADGCLEESARGGHKDQILVWWRAHSTGRFELEVGDWGDWQETIPRLELEISDILYPLTEICIFAGRWCRVQEDGFPMEVNIEFRGIQGRTLLDAHNDPAKDETGVPLRTTSDRWLGNWTILRSENSEVDAKSRAVVLARAFFTSFKVRPVVLRIWPQYDDSPQNCAFVARQRNMVTSVEFQDPTL